MSWKKAVKVFRKKKKVKNIQRFTQKQNLGRGMLTSKDFNIKLMIDIRSKL